MLASLMVMSAMSSTIAVVYHEVQEGRRCPHLLLGHKLQNDTGSAHGRRCQARSGAGAVNVLHLDTQHNVTLQVGPRRLRRGARHKVGRADRGCPVLQPAAISVRRSSGGAGLQVLGGCARARRCSTQQLRLQVEPVRQSDVEAVGPLQRRFVGTRLYWDCHRCLHCLKTGPTKLRLPARSSLLRTGLAETGHVAELPSNRSWRPRACKFNVEQLTTIVQINRKPTCKIYQVGRRSRGLRQCVLQTHVEA